MIEFPKMLYRDGTELVWEGRQLATRIVTSAEDEAKALGEGWRTIETKPAAKIVKKGAK